MCVCACVCVCVCECMGGWGGGWGEKGEGLYGYTNVHVYAIVDVHVCFLTCKHLGMNEFHKLPGMLLL